MSRPRTFDREQKIEEAMELFWETGYEATSVQDLVDHLDLNRSSLYNAFGGKHDLYLDALDHYQEQDLRALQARLQEAPTALTGLRQALMAVAERATESCCGCFTMNAAVECGPRDPDIQKRAREAFEQMQDLFRGTVERAQKNGRIPSSRDATALARHLTSVYNGIHLTAKTDPTGEMVRDIVEETLRGLTCSGGDEAGPE